MVKAAWATREELATTQVAKCEQMIPTSPENTLLNWKYHFCHLTKQLQSLKVYIVMDRQCPGEAHWSQEDEVTHGPEENSTWQAHSEKNFNTWMLIACESVCGDYCYF